MALKGVKFTDEHKRKLSLSKMGDKNPMKKEDVKKKNILSHLGKKHTEEWKIKISQSMKGKNSWSKGKKLSEEHKHKIRESAKRGKENHAWKGGISTLYHLIRCSFQSRLNHVNGVLMFSLEIILLARNVETIRGKT